VVNVIIRAATAGLQYKFSRVVMKDANPGRYGGISLADTEPGFVTVDFHARFMLE